MDGRFDLVALHAWLLLARLKDVNELAQGLTDTIFTGFDEALREQGAGDMSMGHKMKAIADAFFGRLTAYEAAYRAGGAHDDDGEALAAALARNLWRGGAVDERARALASYVRSARQSLEISTVEEGRVDFGPLPDLSARLI
jgi:cytochrome b pre-mRNA-processing protein 3